MEKTLVLIKPDGVQRELTGKIIDRYERKGLLVTDIKMVHPTAELLEKHYEQHKGKDFYNDLINYMMMGPIIALIIKGNNAIDLVRKINGETDPLKAELGSIRGDFGTSKTENLVHASDSYESAIKEISIWFE